MTTSQLSYSHRARKHLYPLSLINLLVHPLFGFIMRVFHTSFGLVALLGGVASGAPYRILNPPLGERPIGSSFGIPGRPATYDYVVIGGGTAGLTVASRLVEQNAGSVAVLEAGSFYEISSGNQSEVPGYGYMYSGKNVDDWQPLIDWGYITVPQKVSHHLILPPGHAQLGKLT